MVLEGADGLHRPVRQGLLQRACLWHCPLAVVLPPVGRDLEQPCPVWPHDCPPLALDFAKMKFSPACALAEHRESLPLSVSFVAWLERRVSCPSACPSFCRVEPCFASHGHALPILGCQLPVCVSHLPSLIGLWISCRLFCLGRWMLRASILR